MLHKMEKQQLSVRVAEQISGLVTDGTYPLGERLPTEPQLAEQLGVGRSTVREAVQGLAQFGILEARQGKGVYVRALPAETEPLSRQLRRADVAEVHEARRAIEAEIAFLAAQRRGDEDVQRMRAALDRREARRREGIDPAALVDADLDFHIAIAQACGNSVLGGLYRSFASVIRESLVGLIEDRGMAGTQAALHEELFDAIRAGEPERARRKVDELLRRIVEDVG
jgi:DNA-binding FadR family transcriptional regulator